MSKAKGYESTADKLRRAEQAKLIESANKKVASGKTPTKKELNAVEKFEAEQRRSNALPYLEAMPKDDFIALFGGSSRVFCSWEDKEGFPWGRGKKNVDALKALAWLRQNYADSRRVSATASPNGTHDELEQRWKAARAEQAELKLAELRGEVIALDDLASDIQSFCQCIKDGVAALCTRDQDTMIEKIREARSVFENYAELDEEQETEAADRA